MDKLRLKEAVIVEGKYDKIKLETLIDGVIIPTDGFRVFNDKNMQQLIRTLAGTCGIIVLTDSDAAGFRVRAMISSIVRDGRIINVYIPDIQGVEKRKKKPSAEGKLGVEGLKPEVLREAFSRAGILQDTCAAAVPAITRLDLYGDGLCGGKDSAARRRALYKRLGLPERLSTSAALPLINRMLTREEYERLVKEVSSL